MMFAGGGGGLKGTSVIWHSRMLFGHAKDCLYFLEPVVWTKDDTQILLIWMEDSLVGVIYLINPNVLIQILADVFFSIQHSLESSGSGNDSCIKMMYYLLKSIPRKPL